MRLGYYEDKNCEICGRVFTPKTGSAKTCSLHCSRKLQAITRKLSYEYDPALKRALRSDEKKSKKDKHKDQLTMDAVEAKKHGVTYGKYMALIKDKKKRDARWSLEFNDLKRRIAESYEEVEG